MMETLLEEEVTQMFKRMVLSALALMLLVASVPGSARFVSVQ